MRFSEIQEGLKDPKDNPCWKGYKPVGTKKKAGRTVPNCVPVKEQRVAEGYQDFNKVEPYEVCLAGKPVKQFDYYEDARRFHDNWKKKLYREGNTEKADKITLNPVMKETKEKELPQWKKDWYAQQKPNSWPKHPQPYHNPNWIDELSPKDLAALTGRKVKEEHNWDDADEFGMPGSEFFPDEDDRLRDGDYVRDRQDGKHGEIFRMSGDPTERRVRILDRDGRGWYISPERLEPVDRMDPDILKYFGKKRRRDMDEGL